MKEAKIIFHGGCLGCLTQNKKGIDFCRKCKYFDADWRPTSAELERIRIKRKYGMDRYETKNRS
jgi:hypothetical protein